ncbi:helix-turn-helix domain-containing protein [Clostridium estertheticum]|uniref:ArsR/SmtB family transcription factor n=1 Tax=Clostridium estertheticum TaxID=238834 RepID=UPI001CF5109C|nr:helix-turn-helix domain-containing protein [Clostridium estertheticum]MCB2308370.1 helix-turn-helix domain-containing protein [Clostridium estertheticum]MCB2346435.1 helix-turn-helix domain-containing protein [Clostridium estertheticum]MCB2349403.1 helix-turn-helix domain-containing protein [Clostridium estertheticum]WAG46383.1 helix-turn-helix domain-containing protein [Clostridium estertheticum]
MLKSDPMVNDIASLIADPSRCIMLMSLLGGQRTAGELAKAACIKPQTATYHLSKMVSAGLIEKTIYGRYRYFNLANEDIAKLLELLMKLSKSPIIKSLNQSIHSKTLRKARLCYDHIAGKLGIKLTEALLNASYVKLENNIFYITELGIKKLVELEIIKQDMENIKDQSGIKCYDWSENSYHIAGRLGYTLANGLMKLCWIKKSLTSRELKITEIGKVNLYNNFNIEL